MLSLGFAWVGLVLNVPLFDSSNLAKYIPSSDTDSSVEDSKKNSSSPLYRLGQGAVLGSNLADEVTTQQDLKNPNLAEGNSLLSSNPLHNALAKGAITSAEMLSMHLLAKAHPRLAGILGIAASVAPTIAAVHNYKMGQKY